MNGHVERRVDRRLLAALGTVVVFHGALLVRGSSRGTYDAYVHLFFADHYRRGWFSTWEPRWYTGFRTVSYPPGTHQLLSLASHLVSGDRAWVPVALGAMVLLTIGVYRFSRIWVDDRAAGYAAILVALSSSVAEALHVFGQLPTLLSLGFLLNALPFGHRWMAEGRPWDLVAAVACSAATTACHHVTTLFGSVFFLGPVIVHAIGLHWTEPLGDEPHGTPPRIGARTLVPLAARRVRRVLRPTLRAGIYGVLVVAGLIVVVYPYWAWSSSDPITQIPIPHASRDNFLVNTNAGLVFWLVPWGLLLLVLPYALLRGLGSRAWPLAASVGLLTLLGTGGTTPIPRKLLGGAFDVLTLDRFTFWATIAVLPLAGRFVDSLLHGHLRHVATTHLGRLAARAVIGVAAAGSVVVPVLSADLVAFRPFQPAPIAMEPIVSFLGKDQHDRWRYLTLGFGDQMAWLSAQTTAESVDGNYHSARRLPELTTTPVERLEGAKYSGVPGLGSLQQFLAVPEKYHLKFVFSNDRFYDPLLWASGWQRLGPLENGIEVWQHDDVSPLPAGRLAPELPMVQRLMWGILPPSAIGLAVAVLGLHAAGFAPRRRGRLPRLVDRPIAWGEGRLRSLAARLPESAADHRAGVLRAARARCRRFVLGPVPRRRARLAAALAAATLVGAGLAVVTSARSAPSPQDVVYEFYDALDLRRFRAAYELLDPTERPEWTEFATQRSVLDGLATSYARLNSMSAATTQVDGDTATVRSTLDYVTALSTYRVESVDRLHRVDGRWRLVPGAPDQRIPPDQFVTRAGVDHFSQGRRQITDGPTAYADVIDRPELRIVSARLVRHAGRLSVVGEVRNIDVDPAYVTVTATLLGDDDAVLTWYSGATGSAHTALPGETIPFRIDFEGVAGLVHAADGSLAAGSVEFSPGASTPLALDPARIGEVWLSAKAVVAGDDLGRSLQTLAVAEGADAPPVADGMAALAGTLRNDGVADATIPHVFVTLRDRDGTVGWVADAFLDGSIRPQRSAEFTVILPTPGSIDRLAVPIRMFANGQTAPDLGPAHVALLGETAGWAGADLLAVAFERAS